MAVPWEGDPACFLQKHIRNIRYLWGSPLPPPFPFPSLLPSLADCEIKSLPMGSTELLSFLRYTFLAFRFPPLFQVMNRQIAS